MNRPFARISSDFKRVSSLTILLMMVTAASTAYAKKALCVNATTTPGCFTTIQHAIDSTSKPVTINIAAGIYPENVNIPAKRSVVIKGAGIGSTIVDAGGEGSVFTAGPNTAVSFSGITVQNGAGSSGGGLLLQNGTYTVSNCEVTGNTLAPGNILGAGIWAAGKLTVINSTITNNVLTPNGQGGGIFSSGNLTIINSTISSNGGSTFPGNAGGGIYYSSRPGSTLKIVGTTISGNQAGRGGGIDIEGPGSGKKMPKVLILQSTIANNQALSGGAIWGGGVLLGILQSTISGNQLQEGGDGFGGGLNLAGGVVGIGDSTITGNSTFNVGGGIVTDSTLVLDNVTIANNFADAEGGGIESLATTLVLNTIIAGNTVGPMGVGPDCARTLKSKDYNLIENLTSDSDCTVNLKPHDITGMNPMLGALANNGGPTQTMALGAGSPAIDAGNPGANNAPNSLSGEIFHCLPVDQRGIRRGKGRCDIGAYQSLP
jgi:fibronectin-binding autotransporter adhesin